MPLGIIKCNDICKNFKSLINKCKRHLITNFQTSNDKIKKYINYKYYKIICNFSDI